MRFRLELRDKDFVVKDILDSEFVGLNWSYSRIGGCGGFSFLLPRKRFEEKSLTGESNIRIYYRNPDTNSHDIWYQGLIERKVPSLSGNSEFINVTGHGYQAQLKRVYLDNVTYTSDEVSVIVKNILDNYVTGTTDISYNAADIEVTSFTPDSITFNENALSAFEKLAEYTGTREWGVDKDRNFFFKARSSSIGERFRFIDGKNITNFQDNQDFTQIVNQVYVQGAQVGGTYHKFGSYDDLQSQSKYNIRTLFYSNSSITTEAVGSQFATSILAEKTEVARRSSASLVDFNALVESTIPIDMVAEISKKTKYGEKRYGRFLYSGIVDRLINRISYALSDNGVLTIDLDLGQPRPSISEQISGIEYNLEQTRQAAL
jgi:hypothetical protein